MKYDFFKRNWFAISILLSLLLRLYFIFYTEGTYDVEIAETHGEGINRLGLLEYYISTQNSIRIFNHPPLMGIIFSWIQSLSDFVEIPFKILFRAFLVPADYLIAYLLYCTFPDNKEKFTTLYLFMPITWIFSSYHGNTDSYVGFFVLAAIFLLGKDKSFLSGVLLGVGANVKWISLLTAPALFFSIQKQKEKLNFFLGFCLTFLLCNTWMILNGFQVLLRNVFLYKGQLIYSKSGLLVWGNQILYAYIAKFYATWFAFPTIPQFQKGANYLLQYNNVAIFCVILMYSWVKRDQKMELGLYRTVAEVFCIFYAVTNFLSFQYFAWSIPFLFFLQKKIALPVLFCLSAYIYLLYSFFCNSYFLLGKWDFLGRPDWPQVTILFRDASLIILLLSSCYFFVAVFSKSITEWGKK